MKTAETKTASSPHLHHTGQPFFQKNGEGTFFSGSQTDLRTKPFFSKQTTTPFIQTKLTIGQPGDKYEQEADAMADQVVQRMSTPETVQAKPRPLVNGITPLIQPKCACEQEEQLQEKEEDEDRLVNKIQRKPVFGSDESPPEEEIQRKCAECEAEEKLQKKTEPNASEGGSGSSLESRLNSSRGSGSPLPADTQTQMESSFGADFSSVRIHAGSSAVQMNEDLHAQAFTHGSDIYFNKGKYKPESTEGKHLLAHELTHTVQQGRSIIQSKQHDDAKEQALLSTDQNMVQGFDIPFTDYETDFSWRGVKTAAGLTADTAVDVGEAIVETGAEVVDVVSDAASEALDWLATEAGQIARDLAAALGGIIRITAAGIEIRLPRICPVGAIPLSHTFDPLEKEFMVPVFGFPIGPDVFITGEVGLVGSITPEIQLQLGPFCLEGARILINPLTSNYSISGSVSATAAAALGAELRGGVKASLGLSAITPVGLFTIPVLGGEGGLAGMIRGIGVGRFTLGGSLTYSGGIITSSGAAQLEMGLGADLFAGAYAQLSVLGENICRIYWQPYEWHGNIAAALGISTDLTIIPGGSPSIIPVINNPTLDQIPFDQIPLVINRDGFSDDCPIIEKVCAVLKALNLLPSQNGGVWDWSGTGHGGMYGPGSLLAGPKEVYMRNPGIASGSTCRGACGPNCDTCENHPVYTFIDPATGDTWQYTNYEDCNSNDGCREHDAAFDWAADAKGESGRWAIIMPWHMAANIECACNNLAGNCSAWIGGLPPYDMKMYFADSVAKISSGTGPTRAGEEEELEQCDKGQLPPDYCEELYKRVIERFGNRERDLDFNPDEDVDEGRTREDDAPILSSFRRMYNRLDSWNIFVLTRHPDWYPEFDSGFRVNDKKIEWMSELKTRTKDYKNRFRDARNQDTEQLRREFMQRDLNEIQGWINTLLYQIAAWYKAKTGSTEDLDAIIERVHLEGTEMWRGAWRAAILAVNRILSRLWPTAKARINGWVAGQRRLHPGKDLSGTIGDIDYIGSLATGFKGAPKQFSRFNPDKFDVDGNLAAPPLAKFAIHIMGIMPDRERIFAIQQNTTITPLINFCYDVHRELTGVPGYDTSDQFDVVIEATNTPSQQRSAAATQRIYNLRPVLGAQRYNQLVTELRTAGLLIEKDSGWQIKPELSQAENAQFNAILRRYE